MNTLDYYTPSNNSIFETLKKIKLPRILPSISVFVLLVLLGRLSQVIFYSFQTSPAVIWSSAGISLAFVLIFGYELWIPIALASFIAAFTNSSEPSLILIIFATIAGTVQPVLGAYLLKRFGFYNSFKDNINILKFIGLSIVIAGIAPLITTPIQYLTHSLSVTFFVSLTRGWAGRLLSIIVFTPLVITWWPWRRISPNRKEAIEGALAFGLLFVSIYFLFWTRLAQSLSFLLLVSLFVALFWIAIRLSDKEMSLANFFLTILGFAGAILYTNPARPLNEQLFSIELFVILIAPIFFALSAVISERRETVKKLEAKMQELKEAMVKLNNEDRSKNEFIAVLAHELRNPLAPIMSTLELIRLQSQNPDTAKMVESAETQAFVMKRLLDDLLDVARVVQKKFKLDIEPVDLHTSIMNCVYSTESIMKSRKHTLAIVSMPNKKVTLNVDRVRFEQIVVNVLNNAAKYTNPGGWIGLTCSVANSHLEIKIEDNGIGISKENMKHVFEPFQQIKPKPNVGTGLGIGLSLAKRLVEMHEGDIRVESEGVGKGSAFIIDFPVPTVAQLPLMKENKKVKEKEKNLKSYKVLVVDDNELAAKGLGKLLDIKGHMVSLAYSGEEAIKAVNEFEPQVVLLDIGLPDMDGYEVAKKLRNSNFNSTIIALTGYGQEEDKIKAINAGFNHHLTKPVGIADLERAIHSSATIFG